MQRIEKLIPQRNPFLFIDEIIDYIPNKYLKALKNLNSTESYLEGHFPGTPVMPGVLMIEACAQASAALMTLSNHNNLGNKVFVLGTVKKFSFKRIVQPDCQLVIEVKLIKTAVLSAVAEVAVSIEEKQVAKGELIFGAIEKDRVTNE